MGRAFEEYCINNRNSLFLNQYGFFKFVDIDRCFNALNMGSIKDVSDFRRAVYFIYNFNNIRDFYVDDIINIKKLDSMLETQFKSESKMKQYNINLLRNIIRSILERLEDNN